MSLTGLFKVDWAPRYRGANDFDQGGLIAPDLISQIQLASGTGANQADLLFTDLRSLAASTDDDLDLAGGLTDPFGNTLTFAEIVGLLVINAPLSGSANVSDLTIGGGSNPFVGFLGGTTPTVGPIKPGGVFCMMAGDAAGIGTVTASTADILRITNGAGGTANYQIAIVGRSA